MNEDAKDILEILLILGLVALGYHIYDIYQELKAALLSEYEAVALYSKISKKESRNPSSRPYDMVAQDEMEHIKILEKSDILHRISKDGVLLIPDEVIKYEISRSGAIDSERDAVNMYSRISRKILLPGLKHDINNILNDEKLHLNIFIQN